MCALPIRLIAISLLFSLFLVECGGRSQSTPLPTAVSPLPTSASIPNPPTPALPSPTPPPTSAPLPTATYDATLDDWTLLVYMDADNNLELPGLLDLNEMEAAGSSEQVNVIVQIDRALGETASDGDWSNPRRYRDVCNTSSLEFPDFSYTKAALFSDDQLIVSTMGITIPITEFDLLQRENHSIV